MLIVFVEIVGRAPGEAARHFDLRGRIGEHVADVLKADDRAEHPADFVFANFSAVSYAARATPTAAIAATGPDQAKFRMMTKSPLPAAPGRRLAAGTRALSKITSAFAANRWPSLSINLYEMPGVPRSTIIADKPEVRLRYRWSARSRFAR